MSRRPDFFIVGFPKCGTTSLYEYLKGHPDVFMSAAKEPRYFGEPETVGPSAHDLVYPDDEQRYLNLFAEARDERRVGEATSSYVYSEAAPSRIRAFQPAVRIIAMVRDPVRMIQSFHSQRVEEGRELIADFEQAVAPEPVGHREYYVDRAGYARYLPRWIDALGRDRVHFIVMEDLVADPVGTYARVLAFLEVDPTYRPDFVAYNTRWTTRFPLVRRAARSPVPQWLLRRALPAVVGEARVRSGVRRFRHSSLGRKETRSTPMSPKLRAELRRDLEPDVARLSEMLGRDLATLWWAKAGPEGAATDG